MLNKKWLIISIIELVIIFILIIKFVQFYIIPTKYELSDLSDDIVSSELVNKELFENGCVPDADAAKRICSPIIDEMVGKKFVGMYEIEYDEINRVWCVSKYTLFEQGGAVVISQDSGAVINAWLYK